MSAQILSIHRDLAQEVSELIRKRFEELQSEDPKFNHEVLAGLMNCSTSKVRRMFDEPSTLDVRSATKLVEVMGRRLKFNLA